MAITACTATIVAVTEFFDFEEEEVIIISSCGNFVGGRLCHRFSVRNNQSPTSIKGIHGMPLQTRTDIEIINQSQRIPTESHSSQTNATSEVS